MLPDCKCHHERYMLGNGSCVGIAVWRSGNKIWSNTLRLPGPVPRSQCTLHTCCHHVVWPSVWVNGAHRQYHVVKHLLNSDCRNKWLLLLVWINDGKPSASNGYDAQWTGYVRFHNSVYRTIEAKRKSTTQLMEFDVRLCAMDVRLCM